MDQILPGGGVGNKLASHAVNPGSILGWEIHSDSDDHYNGDHVSLDPPVARKRTLEKLIKAYLQARSK